MSLAFEISGTFKYPLEAGADLSTVTFAQAGSSSNKAAFQFSLTGSGSQSVDLGTIAGVKALLIEVGTGIGAQPVGVKVNGSADAIEISPGGFMVLSSPSPSTGITQLDIDYTSDISVNLVALG
jgi:hypothetical protein